MQNWSLSILLIAGGAALVMVGALRLAAGWFGAMPAALAVTIVLAGAGVVVFGGVVARLQPVADQLPHVELQPRSPEGTPEPAPPTDVTGTVRRAGGEGIGPVTVVLVSPVEGDVIVRSEAVTTSDGRFEFSGVEIGGPYVVETTFEGTRFRSPSFFAPTSDVEVLVAPTTTGFDRVKIRAASLALVGDEQGVQAVQAITISNEGERAFVSALRLPLLPGATAIQPTTGVERSDLSLEDGALVSRAPVLPGETQISYTYLAPQARTGIDYPIRMDHPTDRLDLLVGGRLHAASARPPARVDRVTVGGRDYERLSWRGLERGEGVRARIGERAPSPLWPVAGIAAAALAAAAIVGWPLLRRRKA